MIWDAFFAETWRLLKNRALVFWSVFAVPLAFGLGGGAFHYLTRERTAEMASQLNMPDFASAPVNLADALKMGADHGANGAILIFMLVAAATVYAGDYRWETWRLITPRNDRISLILGKVGAMKVAAISVTVLFVIACFAFLGFQAAFTGRPLEFAMAGDDWGRTALVWLISYIRIVQYGLIALLAAVVTRSLMASLFVPWALGFAHGLLGSPPALMMLKLEPEGWLANLLMPGLAYDHLKQAVVAGSGSMMVAGPPWQPAFTGMALWTLVPLALALFLFQRQDLSKE